MPIKPGRGRPTKYSDKVLRYVTHYIKLCAENAVFPTIEGLAAHLHVGTRTLYDWEIEYPDFSQTMESLRDIQKQLLITNGLTGNYSTRFAMFLLKANHGMSEKDPLVTNTQNSYMNIPPEVLADALNLMRENQH